MSKSAHDEGYQKEKGTSKEEFLGDDQLTLFSLGTPIIEIIYE